MFLDICSFSSFIVCWQEQINFVESQFQIASANLKQFCIGVIQEILPGSLSAVEEETSNLSTEQNREQHPASELSFSNSTSLKLAVEATEGVHVDSSLQPREDKAMKMSFEDWEKILGVTGKSSAQVASTEETLKMTLSCEGDKGVEVPAKSSTSASSFECLEFDPSMQEEKTIYFTDHGANTSNVPSLTCSIYSTESQESVVLDFDEMNSNAAVPAVSTGMFSLVLRLVYLLVVCLYDANFHPFSTTFSPSIRKVPFDLVTF